MRDVLQELREANPHLHIFGIFDEAFNKYGRVLAADGVEAMERAMRETGIPEEGNVYVASAAGLETNAAIRQICDKAFGGMEYQIGYCNGRGSQLNAFEYHKCSEINFSSTGAVMFLARVEEIKDMQINTESAAAFYLPPNVPVEIYPLTLHFAPCRVFESGFDCMVALERGVNSPLKAVSREISESGEDKLLFMKGKWLLAHPDSPPAKKGAYVGIRGKNHFVQSLVN